MTDATTDLHIHEAAQCFPLHVKKNADQISVGGGERRTGTESFSISQPDNNSSRQDQRRVFGIHNRHDSRSGNGTSRSMLPDEGDGMKDNITDWALNEYKTFYKDDTITKEDMFYYTYGILHHSGYRKKYQKSLVRGLPHIPMTPDFWMFSKASRKLAELHLGYDTCQRYDLGKPLNEIPNNPTSLRFGKKINNGIGTKTIPDDSIFIVNGVKIYDNLPKINYKVNGRTPVGWLTATLNPSKSGIDRRMFRHLTSVQLQEIIERLVYVGLESDKIMTELSKFEFESKDWKPVKAGMDQFIEGSSAQSKLV